ncbi:MAG TPA: hypothetical protein VFC44_13335 [Candidatus Saccharimonadales bacterium]|nr:hypothetical protein [Candidatus Saccharimonadales bacterium]
MLARTGLGQTNFYPVLRCEDGRCFTNATIDAMTPATVMVAWDGGGEKIFITNLPSWMQHKFHYDEEAAQAYLEAQSARRTAVSQRINSDAAAIAIAKATLGPAQNIRIVKTINTWHVQIGDVNGVVSEAYVHNLPNEVLTFVRDFTALKDRVESELNVNYNDGTGAFVAAYTRQAGKAADQQRLAELLPQAQIRETVSARPSAYYLPGGVRQWEYQPASARTEVPTRQGVPVEVYSGIAAMAEKEWPTDYHMQSFVINQQIEAWKKLHP